MKKTCDLFDEWGDRLRVAPPFFQDFGGKAAFHGAAVTVKCHEDNSRIKELVNTPGNGQVLVIDGGGSMRCALFGDVIAKEAVENGWSGVIVFGCIRDKAELRDIPLGIKALAAIPRKSTKMGEGQVNVRIQIGGVECNPGDIVVADEDGVLFAQPDLLNL